MMFKVGDIPVTIQYKSVKTLRIRVKDATVRVTAPFGLGIDKIREFVCLKLDWIEDVLKRQNQRIIEDMNSVSIFGERYPIKVVSGRRSVGIVDGLVVISLPNGSTNEDIQKAKDRYLRGLLGEYLDRRVPILSEYTGLNSSGWYIRDMTTRYGTCNTLTGRLCFSLGLIKYDTECIDYVILHELTHLMYKGHGADFKGAMARFMPNYKNVKKRLKG